MWFAPGKCCTTTENKNIKYYIWTNATSCWRSMPFFPHRTFHNPTAGQTMPIEESEKNNLEGTLCKGTLHLEGVRNLALLHLVIYLCLGSWYIHTLSFTMGKSPRVRAFPKEWGWGDLMMIALAILHYTFQSGKELNPQPLTMRTPVPKPVTNTCLQRHSLVIWPICMFHMTMIACIMRFCTPFQKVIFFNLSPKKICSSQ